ncbi:MAG: GMC family oxidoreductase [Elusimicrobia bacterium]|nr:GMC family oxidoreductase [Elusimicrobiota bacterium]
MTPPLSPADLAGKKWDWIVVCTGIGGATLGHALAAAGRRVLFLEMGEDPARNPQVLTGDYLESHRLDAAARRAEDFLNAGRFSGRIWDATRRRPIHPLLGSGVGGSSALYGMVMERFWPEDFEPRRWHPEAGEHLPARWPISFSDLEPHYRAAEALYRVSSAESDPLRSGQSFAYAAAPAPSSRRLADSLRQRGLHPYALPLARTPGTPCGYCQSFLCAHGCKNDAAKICIEPALQHHGAALLTRATVTSFQADEERVTGVQVSAGDQVLTFQAENFALAAGALLTPALLLKSRSARWPQGLANSSGLVGRYLMRHYIDLFGLPSFSPVSQTKEIGLNDFYLGDGDKYGTVADFGPMPPPGILLEDLDHDRAAAGRRPFPSSVRPLLKCGLSMVMERMRFLALIGEDLPHPDNRVELGENGVDLVIHSAITESERARIHRMRKRVRRALGGWVPILPNADNLKLLAHACGTCRMGEDPRQSVVNPFNRTHDLMNLFIVDGSFFPSSGGVNPALTIAANALRVADARELAGDSHRFQIPPF